MKSSQVKKSLLVVTAAGLVALSFGSNAKAGEPDQYPTIPNGCVFTETNVGPSRVTHSPSVTEELPPCDDLAVCIVFGFPSPSPTATPDGTPDGGPSRTPHFIPVEPDCGDTDPACILYVAPSGPSRALHQLPMGAVNPVEIDVPITQDCQQFLFESIAPEPTPTPTPTPAIPTTGSDSGSLTLIAAALLLVGGGLLIAQRRTANH